MSNLRDITLVALLFFTISICAEEVNIGVFKYTLSFEDKTAEFNGFANHNEYAYHVSIPEKITYNNVEYKVTSIGKFAFLSTSWFITSVEIPNSIEIISAGSFMNCSGLDSIIIPSSVKIIGTRAFYGCSSLSSIEIPNNVVTIGSFAFADCSSLKRVEIGCGVKNIGRCLFECDDKAAPLEHLVCTFGYDYDVDYVELNDIVLEKHPIEEIKMFHPLTGTQNLRYYHGPSVLLNTIDLKYHKSFSKHLFEVITDRYINKKGVKYIKNSGCKFIRFIDGYIIETKDCKPEW